MAEVVSTTALAVWLHSGNPHLSNRAQIVRLTLEGKSPEAIAQSTGLSLSTVKKWQKAWADQGMGIFPPEVPAPAVVAVAGVAAPEDEAVEENEESPTEPFPHLSLEFPPYAAILPTDVIGEAGRKVIVHQFQEMLAQEPIARAGEDIEGVHRMRVATRRLRSAYRIFGSYLDKAYFKKQNAHLRHTAQVLGAVRDLDVFILKTENYVTAYLSASPAPDALQPLLDFLHEVQQEAKNDLLEWLNHKKYVRFALRFHQLLQQPTQGEVVAFAGFVPISFRVDHLLPGLIYAQFEAVRRYEHVLEEADPETLHSLRIEFKRLRYLLEFFEEVLGESIQKVIREIKTVQDHLGDLNDAEVAARLLRDWEKQLSKPARAAVAEYRAFRQAEAERLAQSFLPVWERFNQHAVREALALAVAKL